jgi:hypothetical protein
MLLALWLWQGFCQKPGPKRALLAGLAVGAAHVCKFTAIVLWPAMLAMLLWSLFQAKQRVRELLCGYFAAMLITLVTVNLCYGYDRSLTPFKQFAFQSQAMRSLARVLAPIPAPLPRQMLLGVDTIQWECEQQPPAYLLGDSYRGRRWSYYPIALASKLPLAILILLLMTIASMFFSRRARLRRDSPEIYLLLAFLVLAAGIFAGAFHLNVGIRYLLPLYPLAFVLVSRLWTLGKFVRAAGWSLLALLAVESLSIAPRYLTFFNALVGGPSKGWKIVNDSNFDWGQGLIDLKTWQDHQGGARIELAYFGIIDPAVYGIDYAPFNEGEGARFVAISSYFLTGQRQRTASTHGDPRPLQIPFYRALQRKTPVDIVGRTIFVFRREDVEDAQRGR